MKPFSTAAKLTGIFFLISDATSIVALILFQPILTNINFITSSNVNENQILVAAFLEMLLAFTAVATGIAVYPVLKRHSESLALGYAIFRSIEGTIISVGVLCLLTLLSLRHEFLASNLNPETYQIVGQALVIFKNWTFLYGPNFVLSINATILGYTLYKSKLVPRAISALAMVDGPLIFLSSIAILFGVFGQLSVWGAIIALPMLIFEVSFSIWLLTKGFNSPADT